MSEPQVNHTFAIRFSLIGASESRSAYHRTSRIVGELRMALIGLPDLD